MNDVLKQGMLGNINTSNPVISGISNWKVGLLLSQQWDTDIQMAQLKYMLRDKEN